MAALKSLVDETSNIKNELIECHTNLKNNLTEKGFDVVNAKLNELVNKVSEIQILEFAYGDSCRAYHKEVNEFKNSYDYTEYSNYKYNCIVPTKGFKVFMDITNESTWVENYVKIQVTRDSKEIYSKVFTHLYPNKINTRNSYIVDCSDFIDVEKGDVVNFLGKTAGSYGITLNSVSIGVDLIVK